MLRTAVVAGQFYPGQKESLLKSVTSLMPTTSEQKSAIAVMSPHAGYIYSGKVAGQTFAGVKIPSEVIILGPNHHGRGHVAAVYASGAWETPIGQTLDFGQTRGAYSQGMPDGGRRHTCASF